MMIHFSKAQIKDLQHIKRINLINSCTGFKSANLIATKSKEGIENVAVFSSVTHFGSNPPLLGVVFRPTTAPRNTYENIKATGIYTINSITEELLEEAHKTSAKFPAAVSEFEATNLKAAYRSGIDVPFVKGSPLQMELQFVEEYHIKANGTLLVLGEIKNLFVAENILREDGFINLSEGKIATINGLDSYALTELKKRLPYQSLQKEK